MPPDDTKTPASWPESGPLIAFRLGSMAASIEGIVSKIDALNEKISNRDALLTALVTEQISKITVRVAMLEVRAKIWGGMIGGVGGIISAAVIFLIEKVIK